MKVKKQKKGISLIVLIITIIVMIILASAIIISISNSGIIEKARKAVDLSNESGIKEALEITVTLLKQEDKLNEENLKVELEKSFNEDVEVTKDTDGSYIVTVNEKYFTIEDDGITNGKYDKWDGTKLEPTSMTDSEIHIYKASELKWVQEQVAAGNLFENYTIYLENNLDLGAREGTGDTLDAKWKTEANKAKQWIPIGKTKALALNAKFEGNDHIIKGVYVEETTNFAGLFACAGNVVQNLSIKNSYVEGTNCTGGLVGLASSDITNCHNINTTVVQVEGAYHTIGGVVGQIAESTISNSTNSGDIFGNGLSSANYTRCGGVAGAAYVANNCSNTGNISSKGAQTGGVVGILGSNAKDCVNNGYVCSKNSNENAYSYTGGVVGLAGSNSTIENCSNNANVEGNKGIVGGIVGYLQNSSEVDNCYNRGKVKAGYSFNTNEHEWSFCGGIVGYCGENCSVKFCQNTAVIVGDYSSVGGILGYGVSGISLTNCKNMGDIIETNPMSNEPNADCGGIVGSVIRTGEITNCYNSGTVRSGGQNAGGIVGMIYQSENKTDCTIKNNINVGTIEGVQNIGGIIGWIGGSEGGTKVSLCYNKGNITGQKGIGSIVGCETCTTGANTYNHLYYLSSLNLGAIDGVDNVDNNVTSAEKNINTFEEFKTWIAQFETE